MKEFLVGLLVIVVILLFGAVGILLFPLLLLLGVFLRLLVGLFLILFTVWLVGKLTLLAIDYLKSKDSQI